MSPTELNIFFEELFSLIEYKDPIWIAIAFIFGLFASKINQPPLVGFLIAGFVLNYLGADSGFFLQEMANLGVTLLLFTIGLKLNVKSLLRTEVWGVTLVHTLLISGFISLCLFALTKTNLLPFKNLNLVSILIIGFALSFSSTVFVAKILEDRAEQVSQYGRLAIGVLVIQDIFAVLFLGISEAKSPSIFVWLLIITLFIARPILHKLLTKTGHGELLVLYGLTLALGGASLFEAVDLKADLGALVFGVLLANHSKAQELVRALLHIKELFLVGFFLSIGLAEPPNLSTFIAVSIFLLFLPLKSGLFLLLFSSFKVRIAHATSTAIVLGNYSEFGLIVTSVAVSHHWLPQQWLTVMAVLVAISIVISSSFSDCEDFIYTRFRKILEKLQRQTRLRGDEDIDLTDVHILVCGMGRVGSGAYDYLIAQGEKNVLGVDSDIYIITQQTAQHRKVVMADVSSIDFWSRLDMKSCNIEWILLCTSNVTSNTITAKLARNKGFKGFISSTTHYTDEAEKLKKAGVNAVFNIYAEAGVGLAQQSEEIMHK